MNIILSKKSVSFKYKIKMLRLILSTYFGSDFSLPILHSSKYLCLDTFYTEYILVSFVCFLCLNFFPC